MDVTAITRNVRLSALKGRPIAREVQGLPVAQALQVVQFSPQKAAFALGKTLKSALANAENNHGLKPEALRVKEAVAGAGTTIRRFTPKARGSAGPILKRSCHIRIVLSDQA